MPDIFETTDAAASTSTTYSLGIGRSVQGLLGAGDSDWYRVNLVAGQTYTFGLIATGTSTQFDDTVLTLRNASGAAIVTNDDGGPGLASTITFTATTTGAHYLDASAYNGVALGQYGLSAVLGNRADYDESMGAGALMSRVTWEGLGSAATVTWANRATFPGSEDAAGYLAPFSNLTASQVAAVRQSLGNYSEVARLTFNEVNPGGTSNNATMLFSNYSSETDGAGAYAYYPGSTLSSSDDGDVRLNTEHVSTSALPRGSYSYYTVLHEIGHAVGLSHPGDYNAGPGQAISYNSHAQFTQDSHQYTVMSYFDESNTTGSMGSYPDTLMMLDILALQRMYGVNTTTRSGNTIYGSGSNAGPVYDFAFNSDPFFCIWDAGGTDTIDGSGFAGAQLIDLNDGAFSNLRGFTGNVSIAIGAVIERAVGGSGNDRIIGNDVNNRMWGGLGNDSFFVNNVGDLIFENNGQGTDWVNTSVSYELRSGAHVERLQTTNAAGAAAIALTGNTLAQVITGNAGANRIDGGGHRDTLIGLGGDDRYTVDDARVRIREEANSGADVVYTSISFALTAGAHIERMNASSANNTFAMNLTGNEFGQSLVGNDGNNRLNGRGGRDALTGNDGNDRYIFSSAVEAGLGSSRDSIKDFEDYGDNDIIDLSSFAGTLSFRGTGGFNGANQVRAVQSGSHVLVQINTGGSLTADAEILLIDTSLAQVNANDFLF